MPVYLAAVFVHLHILRGPKRQQQPVTPALQQQTGLVEDSSPLIGTSGSQL